jgi:pimeloyl-ACP methyl ester carboxylesterase
MSNRRALVRPFIATICLLAGVLVVGGPPATAGSPSGAIQWRPCFQQPGLPFECGTLEVPLDYSNPAARTILISMSKLPAADQRHRIGTLFLNPGGPGGSGFDFALGVAPYLYGGAAHERFDIIGFDPRGIIRSNPVRCFQSRRDWGPAFTPFAFPYNRRMERVWRQADLYVVGACERRAHAIIDHMATADVARDLDRMRVAVGDEGLTYMGVSYGSFLGQTYANMFPSRVRAIIIDGILDPIAWTTGVDDQGTRVPFSTRLHSAMGAQATLDEFFRLCDRAGRRCAFSPHASDRYLALATKLRRDGPITLTFPDGHQEKFDYSALVANTLDAMYFSGAWPFLARFLWHVEQQAGSAQLGADLQALHDAVGLGGGSGHYQNYLEGFPGVACSDAVDPTSYQAWHDYGIIEDQEFGYFGRLWTWITSICAKWPGHDAERYLGPFTRHTANPVLIIGNLFDPATRYQGAQIAHRLLPDSSLLTLHGWGHTSLFESACIDGYSVEYLETLSVPPAGKICQQDVAPFETSGGGRSVALRARVVGGLLPARLVHARAGMSR